MKAKKVREMTKKMVFTRVSSNVNGTADVKVRQDDVWKSLKSRVDLQVVDWLEEQVFVVSFQGVCAEFDL